MNIVQIVSIALVATMIILVLKQYKPEYALFVSILGGVILFAFALSKVSSIITLLENLTNHIGIDQKFFSILLKITGIAYLTEFAIHVCKDAGESAIASKLEVVGKILIVSMSIPIISTLLETVMKLL